MEEIKKMTFRINEKKKKELYTKLLQENKTAQKWFDKQVQKYLKEDEKK